MDYRTKALGFNHPDVSDAVTNVGIALGKIGEDELAMVNLRKTLKIRINLRDQLGAASIYHNIGNLERKRGKCVACSFVTRI